MRASLNLASIEDEASRIGTDDCQLSARCLVTRDPKVTTVMARSETTRYAREVSFP